MERQQTWQNQYPWAPNQYPGPSQRGPEQTRNLSNEGTPSAGMPAAPAQVAGQSGAILFPATVHCPSQLSSASSASTGRPYQQSPGLLQDYSGFVRGPGSGETTARPSPQQSPSQEVRQTYSNVRKFSFERSSLAS